MCKFTPKWIVILLFPVLATCQAISTVDTNTGTIRELTVLYTNDEHGWMEGMEPGQGAAHLYNLWQRQEGFSSDGSFLVLSGGDNWTGPAISTWVGGESMVEVMNAMDYDGTAVGNHEFDFGLDVLKQRISEADFPYLSANTRWKNNGEIPVELGILPYTIKEVNGITVGIVGLTTTSTPRTANPQLVSGLEFREYEQALRTTVMDLQSVSPDLLFVIAHVCMAELEVLARDVVDLSIDLMGGGHCNELTARRVGETVLLGGGHHFTSYAKAHFRYDVQNDQLVTAQFAVNTNFSPVENAGIASIVDRWQERFRDSLGQVIAWSDSEIDYRTREFRQAVIDSWLIGDSSADFAITNAGGLRTPLPAGEITLNDIVNVMPFENNIVAVNIPGYTVVRALEEGGRPIVAGLIKQGGSWIVSKTGDAIEYDQSYRVLINSFMYAGGDNYQVISQYDPDGYDTGIHYRQPFIDALLELKTSSANPVNLQDLIRTR